MKRKQDYRVRVVIRPKERSWSDEYAEREACFRVWARSEFEARRYVLEFVWQADHLVSRFVELVVLQK